MLILATCPIGEATRDYKLTEATEATVRLFPDVIVESHGDNEWIAMGREAAVAGETLILDIVLLDTDPG